MKKNVMLWVLILLMAFGSSAIFAAGGKEAGEAVYPKKPVDMTIGFAAGVSADIVGRKLVSLVEKELGQPVVVNNRPGAGGSLAYQYMSTQKPDGYSILWISNSISTTYLQGNMDLNYESFDMVAGITSEQSVIAVPANARWKNFEEYVAEAKKNPETITVGNGGLGSFNHLTAVAIENAVGAKFHHIPFGTSVVPALLGGQVESSCTMAFSNIPLAQAGELRLLASTGEKRLQTIDGVPTLKELGYDFTMFMYRGVAVPKGTPKDIIKKLEAAFKTAVESEEFISFAKQNSMDITWMDSEEFTKFVEEDFNFLKELMTGMGITDR